ncbi:MAG: MotA/TolQ/ExbB proton channel family protein [Sedimentisphaerales bacterium]|jgi:biopolymer transport protein ExbB
MSKGNLTKTIFLACAAVGVTAILAAAWRVDFSSGGAAGWARPRTYFEQFFTAGGPVVWFVLLPMSVVTVYLAAEYFITIRRRWLLPDDISGTIVSAAQQTGLSQLPARLAGGEDFISVAITRAVTQCGGDPGRMRNLVEESLQEQAMRFLRKIEWVNIIGNVSPMVGLFGTVLGIIKMFNAIAAVSGQPHPSQLAGGISVALVTTFWGLMIAIPALTIHGFFQNRIETLACEAAEESEKLILQLARMLREQKLVEQQKAAHSTGSTSSPQASSGQAQPITEIPSRQSGTLRPSALPRPLQDRKT